MDVLRPEHVQQRRPHPAAGRHAAAHGPTTEIERTTCNPRATPSPPALVTPVRTRAHVLPRIHRKRPGNPTWLTIAGHGSVRDADLRSLLLLVTG
jgi:hypothetical protein